MLFATFNREQFTQMGTDAQWPVSGLVKTERFACSPPLRCCLKWCVAKSRKKVSCSDKKPSRVLDALYPPESPGFSASSPRLHCAGLAHPSVRWDGLFHCPFPKGWPCCCGGLPAPVRPAPVSHHTGFVGSHHGCPCTCRVEVPEVAQH